MRGLYDEGNADWADWFWLTSYATRMSTSAPLQLLGNQPLLIRTKVGGPLIGTIPENQWQIEVLHWHSTAMADLQQKFLRSMVGFSDPKRQHLIKKPATAKEKEICANQVYTND